MRQSKLCVRFDISDSSIGLLMPIQAILMLLMVEVLESVIRPQTRNGFMSESWVCYTQVQCSHDFIGLKYVTHKRENLFCNTTLLRRANQLSA